MSVLTFAIITVVLFCFAGFNKAVSDTIKNPSHFKSSQLKRLSKYFANYDYAWRNAYTRTFETGDRGKVDFLGSNNFWIGFTDAWHKTQSLMIKSITFYALAFGVFVATNDLSLKQVFVAFFLSSILGGLCLSSWFTLYYQYILKREKLFFWFAQPFLWVYYKIWKTFMMTFTTIPSKRIFYKSEIFIT